MSIIIQYLQTSAASLQSFLIKKYITRLYDATYAGTNVYQAIESVAVYYGIAEVRASRQGLTPFSSSGLGTDLNINVVSRLGNLSHLNAKQI